MANILFADPGSAASQDVTTFSSATALCTSVAHPTGATPRVYKCDTGATPSVSYYIPNTSLADAGRSISFRFRMETLPTGLGYEVPFTIETGASAVLFNIWVADIGGGDYRFILENAAFNIMAVGLLTLAADTDYYLEVAYKVVATNNWDFKLKVNSTIEFETDETISGFNIGNTGGTLLALGPLYGLETNWICYFWDIVIDDESALAYPGVRYVTAKLPLGVTDDAWVGTDLGTGAINERPLSESNAQVNDDAASLDQTYILQDRATGDIDISNKTLAGYMAWVWAAEANVTAGAGEALIHNNTVSAALTLTTTPSLHTAVVQGQNYPSAARGIGMQSSGGATDVIMYECGIVVVYTDVALEVPEVSEPIVQDLAYQIWILDTNGVRQALLTHYLRLDYTLQINGFNFHTLTLDAQDPSIDLFVLDAIIEVYRRDTTVEGTWRLVYEGFHRTSVFQTNDGVTTFSSYGRGFDDLLDRRVILYKSGSAGSDKTGPGETVIKAFVEENAGPSATTGLGREIDGVTPGLTVQITSGAGTTFEGARSYRNLLETLQDIAQDTGIDFKTLGIGPALFQFTARAAPWGANRSIAGLDVVTGLNAAGNVPVIFSLGFGNMSNPILSINRTAESNAIIVLGQGVGAARTLVEVSDIAKIADSPWNRREASRQANNQSTVAALTDVGNTVLKETTAIDHLSFRVLQTTGTLFMRDYEVGDLITAHYRDYERNLKITQIAVAVFTGREDIQIELSALAHQGDANPLLRRVRALEAVE